MTPHSSQLTAHTSHHTPHTTHHTPQTSHLSPLTSYLSPLTLSSFFGLHPVSRQGHHKRRPAPRRLLMPYPAAVRLDGLAHQGQSQAGATGLPGHVGVEQPLAERFR